MDVAAGHGYSIEVRAYGHKHRPENRGWDVKVRDSAGGDTYIVGRGATALEAIYAWKWLHGVPES